MNKPDIPEEEIVPRGQEIYHRDIGPKLGPEAEGKFVVIDVESGDYEIADDDELAFERAERKHPERVFFVLRVGPEASQSPAYRIGSGGATERYDC